MKYLFSIIFVLVFSFAAYGQTQCTYSFNPALIPASGGAIDYGIVKNNPDCNIVVRAQLSNPDWVHGYTADANPGAARSGFVYFVVGSFPGVPPSLANGSPKTTVYQASGITPTCAYALGTLSQAFISAGDTGFVDVQAQAGCSFSSISNNDFITITNGADGTGSGTVTFTVAANSGAARTGTLFIAGQTFTVNQSSAKSRKRVRFF